MYIKYPQIFFIRHLHQASGKKALGDDSIGIFMEKSVDPVAINRRFNLS